MIIFTTGLLISSLYALSAIGFTLIFGVMGVLNLSYGSLMILGGYFIILFMNYLAWNVYLSFVVSVFLVSLVSLGIYKTIVKPIQKDHIATMMVTFLLAIAIEQLLTIFFTPEARMVAPLITGDVQIAGIRLPWNRLLAAFIAWLTIGLLWLFVNRTKLGKALLATSMDLKGADLVGIDSDVIYIITWVISGALAAIAGFFLGTYLSLSPELGFSQLTIAFASVVLGGLGSIPGSLIAAHLIGFLETITVFVLSPAYRGLPALIVLVLILYYKPEGIWGRATH